MSHSIRYFRVPVAGTLAGASAALIASPAMAASTFALQNALAGFGTREWLLSASLLLLLVALAGRLMRGRSAPTEVQVVEESPDLRWWRSGMVTGY